VTLDLAWSMTTNMACHLRSTTKAPSKANKDDPVMHSTLKEKH
jgi:hypothetical protein